MLPIVCLLYVLSYLDRGNIGNAKTAGAQHDLGLSSSQVSLPYVPGKSGKFNDIYAVDLGAQQFLHLLCPLRVDCAVLEDFSGTHICCPSLLRVSGAGTPYLNSWN